ncbi:MAG TPA: hypothetical protein VF369_08365 [candidate division Zixibacteria bacterium]
MPANQSKVDPTQTDSRLSKRGEESQSKYQTYPKESLEIKQKKLRNTLLSLSGKLDELEQVNQKLFQLIDSNTTDQTDSNTPVEETSAYEISPSETSSSSHLVYQLSSLMDGLKPILNWHNWGVFLLRGDASGPVDPEGGFEEVASSYHFETNQSARDFDNEVKSQYTCGNIHQAINRKKRINFPAERGNILIVPLPLSDGKGGFWAMHIDKEKSIPSDSDKELLVWGADMINVCLENAYGHDTCLSPKGENRSWLEKEKLFSMSQLSRAMIHEVNNSMQIILGRAQIARMNLNKSKEGTSQNHLWEAIENNANRINGTLKNFSDFLHRHSVSSRVPVNRGSEKNISVSAKEVNLHRILESNLSLLQYILGSSGIELELKSGGDLPSVYGEPEELELVFLSLLWGIRDNLPGGGNIRIQTFLEEESLCLSVDWAGKKSDQEKSPGGKESGDYTRLNQAIKILEKFDRNLRFENVTGKEGKIMVKIPVVKNKTQVSRKEVKF